MHDKIRNKSRVRMLWERNWFGKKTVEALQKNPPQTDPAKTPRKNRTLKKNLEKSPYEQSWKNNEIKNDRKKLASRKKSQRKSSLGKMNNPHSTVILKQYLEDIPLKSCNIAKILIKLLETFLKYCRNIAMSIQNIINRILLQYYTERIFEENSL